MGGLMDGWLVDGWLVGWADLGIVKYQGRVSFPMIQETTPPAIRIFCGTT